MAVELIINVPDASQSRVVESFDGMANRSIQLNFNGLKFEFIYTERDTSGGETYKQFAQRVLKELGKLLMNIYETEKDFRERYLPEREAVELPNIVIPDEVFESTKTATK